MQSKDERDHHQTTGEGIQRSEQAVVEGDA